MRSYELIKDLERKLSLYERDQPPSRQVSSDGHQRIAELIVASEIYPPLLNRVTVIGLLEGRQPWLTEDGGEFYLAYSTDVEVLEAARAISFPNGCLQVLSPMEVDSEMPARLRCQLNGIQFLNDIQGGWDGMLTPRLRIAHSTVTANELMLLEQYFKRHAEHLVLSIETCEVQSVGAEVWRLLRASNTVEGAFAEFTNKMKLVSGWNFIFEIDDDKRPRIDEHEFLEAGVAYLLEDTSLSDDWSVCATDVVLARRGVRAIACSDEAGQRKYPDQLELGLIKDALDPARKIDSLFEKAQWWSSVTQWGHHSGAGISGSLVGTVIRSENNQYAEETSFPLTKALLEHAPDLPRLTGMLLESATDIKYLCMLLSYFPVNHVGLVKIYWHIKRIRQLNSTKIAYDKIWQDLLWTQTLEIYVDSYALYLSESLVIIALENACEAIVNVVEGELGSSSRGKLLQDTYLPSLNRAIMSIRYTDVSGASVQLLPNNVEALLKVVKFRLGNGRRELGEAPFGEWLVLFWVLNTSFFTQGSKSVYPRLLAEVLVKSYFSVLNMRLKKKCNEREDPAAFDELSWDGMYQYLPKGQRSKLVHVFEDRVTGDMSDDPDRRRSFISGVRMHLRLLLNLHAAQALTDDSSAVENEIVSMVEKFGFGEGHHSAALDYFIDNSEHNSVRLWREICIAANKFEKVTFERLVTLMSMESVPLIALFTFLESTESAARIASIQGELSKRKRSLKSAYWLPQIMDMITKAANNNEHGIASHYLEYAKAHSHSSHAERINTLTEQIVLKRVFDDPDLSADERVEKLKAIRRDRESHNSVVENYNDYLLATAEIEVDLSSAIRRFERLSVRSRAVRDMTGLVRAVFERARKEGVKFDAQLYCHQWVQHYERLKPSSLDDSDIYYILKLSLSILDREVFDKFWSIASTQQQDRVEISLLRWEYLKNTGRAGEALDCMRRLRMRHSDLPEEINAKVSSFESELFRASVIPIAGTGVFLQGVEPIHAWNSICNMQAVEQVRIFNNGIESVDEYVLDVIDYVGKELLLRRMHLSRPSAVESLGTPLLMVENMINDWLVSLVRHRMSFAGWTVYDQSRSGSSASGTGVGEVDGWIKDKGGKYIALIEAFRLMSVEKKVIREHLNKIHRYNSVGCNSVLVVVYAAVSNFKMFSDKYCAYVKKLSYDGFESNSLSPLEGISSRDNPNIRYYKEVRSMNQVPVTFYHQLLNLQS
ncbi:hypothetical protein [Pseudomonas sp. WS 5146]|uniref:hypothetical protein n=1 Tax=Pseudomonas sp. WS 5146 TaxID=2717494 RepID=UPI001475A5BB|nr:hypothetical protein [Pseudomonas sp. WS 5146]NMX56117.1 hypothetical protein [Pseudomonas sp. WS 5146]